MSNPIREIGDIALTAVSLVWRRLMFRTRFVAVTGSVGKTTATRCLGTILAIRYPTNVTARAGNGRHGLSRTLLKTRPGHRYTVIEVGTRRSGALWRACLQIKPHVAVVLSVVRTHSHRFSSLEVIAKEKARLLARLGANGIAVLNGEDPYVAAMAEPLRCRVVTFGRRPGFDLWASDVSGTWPDRMTFRVHQADESYVVSTQYVGVHWVNSVLGALAAAVACGVPLRDAAEQAGKAAPFRARLEPAPLLSGAIMLRDEFQGSGVTLDAAYAVMSAARDCRRVVVQGDMWDMGLEPLERYRDLGRRAAESSDAAVFIGELGPVAKQSAVDHGMNPAAVHHFEDLQAAAPFLQSELQAGDLVLLKGKTEEHFSRLYFADSGPVACWKTSCDKTIMCDFCPDLRPR